MNYIKSILLKCSGMLLHNQESKILFYHDVFDGTKYTEMGTPLSLFKKHLQVVEANGFHLISQITVPQNQIQICFDDGFAGLWDCQEIWNDLTWRPTIFVPISLIGQPGYLSLEQIKTLHQKGFRFQSHGWSHQVLTDFSGKELLHETSDSKHYLEDALQTTIEEICFPVGLFSQSVLKSCKKAGYKQMYSSIPGSFQSQPFPNVLRRNLVQFYTEAELKAVLFGALAPFARRYLKMHYQA